MIREDLELPSLETVLDFLHKSRSSLREFNFRKASQSSNLSKEMRQVLNEWVAACALEMMAEWFMLHGDELVARLNEPPKETPKENPADALPMKKPPQYEFWREGERRINSRRRAG